MSFVGSPIASKIIAMVRTPPAGIPAAPTLEAVAVTLSIKLFLAMLKFHIRIKITQNHMQSLFSVLGNFSFILYTDATHWR